MDSSQWPQGIGVAKGVEAPKKPRPEKEKALNCPRCSSTNTKFCYYNNYSLSQPRYFCKTCRRYWTEGGSLRNVPVGGGSRKNRRSITSSSSPSISSSSSKKLPDLATTSAPTGLFPQNPKLLHHHDLNLAYNPPIITTHNFTGISEILNLNPNSLEFLKNGISSFMGMPAPAPPPPPAAEHHSNTAMFLPNLHDAKPNGCSGFNFSLDGFCNGYQASGVNQESGSTARVFFPGSLEDLKPVSAMADDDDNNRGQGDNEANGFWNGMLGGGGSSW